MAGGEAEGGFVSRDDLLLLRHLGLGHTHEFVGLFPVAAVDRDFEIDWK